MPAYTNKFEQPQHMQGKILGPAGRLVGTMRIKPSSVLWKPSGAHDFYAVPLDRFTEWIKSPKTQAERVDR